MPSRGEVLDKILATALKKWENKLSFEHMRKTHAELFTDSTTEEILADLYQQYIAHVKNATVEEFDSIVLEFRAKDGLARLDALQEAHPAPDMGDDTALPRRVLSESDAREAVRVAAFASKADERDQLKAMLATLNEENARLESELSRGHAELKGKLPAASAPSAGGPDLDKAARACEELSGPKLAALKAWLAETLP